MHFNVDSNMIALLVSGSHAYGMGTETSDLDIRGACIPPRRIRESYYRWFEQWQSQAQVGPWGERSAQGLRSLSGTALASYERDGQTADVTIYSITKLVGLAANANPNVLELLFLDESDILFSAPGWRILLANRDLFLSQKCRHTYAGYAHAQLRKIKSHREWLLNPPEKEPARGDFGLPESSVLPSDVRNLIDESVVKVIRQWGVDEGLDDVLTGAALDVLRERMLDFQSATMGVDRKDLDGALYETACASLGIPGDVLAAVKSERAYRAARKHWGQYLQWKRNRNPARAELEERYGYDCKHGAHLLRLARSGVEVVRDGVLQVRRPDADELLAVRRGAVSYDDLVAEAEALEQELKGALSTSPLRKTPPADEIDDLLFTVITEAYGVA